jgi:tRNA modification GTPase
VAAPLAAMFPDRATIFALASAPGAAGVAVWRVSGPQAAAAYKALCSETLPQPRTVARVHVHDSKGETIDDGLALWMPGPKSFTGEDVLELHTHGGRAVAQAMTVALNAVSGLRPADPGEFTRRAVEAGKLDLTQAEAIADLVSAETEAQRRQARRQLSGALGALYGSWSKEILGILARFEAGMDFPDEEVPAEIFSRARPHIEALLQALKSHLVDGGRGERLREGIRIAIVGAPNVGKSSLVNALARRDVAIVSNQPGTTRDIIEVGLDLGGIAAVVADTAGLRESDNEIEREGIRRAKAWAGEADIVISVLDATAEAWSDLAADGQPSDKIANLIHVGPRKSDGPTGVLVINKVDSAPGVRLKWQSTIRQSGSDSHLVPMFISARTGEGIDELIRILKAKSVDFMGSFEVAPITRARHRAGVECAADSLVRALVQEEVELAGEDLRQALRALGEITGRVGVEEILDVIFREFCIGK